MLVHRSAFALHLATEKDNSRYAINCVRIVPLPDGYEAQATNGKWAYRVTYRRYSDVSKKTYKTPWDKDVSGEEPILVDQRMCKILLAQSISSPYFACDHVQLLQDDGKVYGQVIRPTQTKARSTIGEIMTMTLSAGRNYAKFPKLETVFKRPESLQDNGCLDPNLLGGVTQVLQKLWASSYKTYRAYNTACNVEIYRYDNSTQWFVTWEPTGGYDDALMIPKIEITVMGIDKGNRPD